MLMDPYKDTQLSLTPVQILLRKDIKFLCSSKDSGNLVTGSLDQALSSLIDIEVHLGRRISVKDVAEYLGLDIETVRRHYRDLGGIRHIYRALTSVTRVRIPLGRNSLAFILPAGHRDISLNYYTGQLEPLPYLQ